MAVAGVLARVSVPALAQTPDFERWNAKVQATYVWQDKRPFGAAYSGPNSLSPGHEHSYSFTATLALGFRPWQGGELYFDPEAAQGVPLSGLTGLGGFTNGEMARTAGPSLRIYRSRLFLRQSWGMGGEAIEVPSEANQLAGTVDSRRWVLTAGNLSVIDIFDDNAYSHDPRTQFLNWSLITHGAYDFAADARGYSWGAALEWYHDQWAVRAGRFAQPKEPNQQQLDHEIFQHFGDQLELEHAHVVAGQPGKLRLLAFRNQARMSRFRDALDLAAATGTTPDINAVRTGARTKYGFGMNLEQAISPDVGIFARASWADGATETYAFTEIDRSVSGGLMIRGSSWKRGQDNLGIAFAHNGLSSVRQQYLSAGGLGFFIGDGRLSYRPESILEVFYNASLTSHLWVAFDWQHIVNPAYNADRGPVDVGSVRMHIEF